MKKPHLILQNQRNGSEMIKDPDVSNITVDIRKSEDSYLIVVSIIKLEGEPKQTTIGPFASLQEAKDFEKQIWDSFMGIDK